MNQLRVLTNAEAVKLKEALRIGLRCDEWEDWDNLLEEIGHKYISDKDEYKFYESELENICPTKETKILAIDELIYVTKKYHYCCID